MAGVEQPNVLVLLVAVVVGLHLSVLAENTVTAAATAVADSELSSSDAELDNE